MDRQTDRQTDTSLMAKTAVHRCIDARVSWHRTGLEPLVKNRKEDVRRREKDDETCFSCSLTFDCLTTEHQLQTVQTETKKYGHSVLTGHSAL